MDAEELKDDLVRYLQRGRGAVLWKLDGLGEYDVRRPMTPTGTNLLGIVKHLAAVDVGYFGECFGRPYPHPMPFVDEDAEPNADLWATLDESKDDIVALYRDATAHSDASIAALPLDAIGQIPWWPPERREVTLHRMLVHVTDETARHAGHMDILRELIDGSRGVREGNSNVPDFDDAWWVAYRDRLEDVAQRAGAREITTRASRYQG